MKTNPRLFSNLNKDFPAGLVVFLVALPLCLGIALASGAPLFSGIIAGIVGGIVTASLSGSALSVSGPAAGLTVIVLSAITSLGSFDTFLLAVAIGGAIQIGLGFLRAGIIGYYFPTSVIKGMLAAIGIILILKQIPHALGYDADVMGDQNFQEAHGGNTFSELFNSYKFMSIGAIIISAVSLAILILWDKPFLKRFSFFKLVPGALIVVILGVVINQIYKAVMPELALGGDHLVVLPVSSNVTEFIGQFTLPNFSALTNPQVYVVAVTIAIVASLETLLSVEATDKLDPYKRITPTNKELIAQGTGNMVSGLIGGLPLTAVIVRSSANVNAGAKTKMSAIIHGMLLLGCAILIPNILNMIPLACLAAVLLMVGYKLAKVSLFKEMYKLGWKQFLPFVVTIVAIVFTDLLKGIGIGMAVSIFFILRNNYKVPYFFHKEKQKEGETIKLELSEDVSFLNKGSIMLTLKNIPKNSSVIIDGSKSQHIDYDVLEIIENFKETAKLQNIDLQLVDIPQTKVSNHH